MSVFSICLYELLEGNSIEWMPFSRRILEIIMIWSIFFIISYKNIKTGYQTYPRLEFKLVLVVWQGIPPSRTFSVEQISLSLVNSIWIESNVIHSSSTNHLNFFLPIKITNRIQEQLRRIKRNEERERLRQLKERIDQGDIEQPTAEDQAKLDALSDKPTKIVRLLTFLYILKTISI